MQRLAGALQFARLRKQRCQQALHPPGQTQFVALEDDPAHHPGALGVHPGRMAFEQVMKLLGAHGDALHMAGLGEQAVALAHHIHLARQIAFEARSQTLDKGLDVGAGAADPGGLQIDLVGVVRAGIGGIQSVVHG